VWGEFAQKKVNARDSFSHTLKNRERRLAPIDRDFKCALLTLSRIFSPAQTKMAAPRRHRHRS
jgi:hypothetical protein